MLTSYNSLILIIIIISAFVFLLHQLYKYKKIIDDKNVRLIQFYLDSKFICKELHNNLTIPDSNEFCNKFIENIKEYYNLEDILIIDSMRMLNTKKSSIVRNINTRAQVVDYVIHNIDTIETELITKKLTKIDMQTRNMMFSLHIYPILPEETSDGIVICVESPTSFLKNKREILGLENCINLLRTRLIYD